jgi:hypothetical protein
MNILWGRSKSTTCAGKIDRLNSLRLNPSGTHGEKEKIEPFAKLLKAR